MKRAAYNNFNALHNALAAWRARVDAREDTENAGWAGSARCTLAVGKPSSRVRRRMLQRILTKMFPPMVDPIAELAGERRVTVRGEVVPRDLMDSPLTATPCVYYQYSVENWRRSRVGGDVFWELVERDEAILEFYVADPSGRAIVSPTRARVTHARGVAAETIDLGIDRQGRELRLEPGDRIEVTGEAIRVHDLFDEGRNYRDTADRFMLRAPKHGRLEIRLLAKRRPRSG